MKAKLKFIIPIVIAVIAIIVAALCIDFTPQERADVSSLMSTAQKFLVENQYEQAIAEFNKVIEFEPKNVDAYLGLAEAYVGIGDTDKAIEVLEKGYEITGDERINEKINNLITISTDNGETSNADNYICNDENNLDSTDETTTERQQKMIIIPNFVGLISEEADEIVQQNNLSVKYDEIYSNDVEKGHIISQIIPVDAEAPAGTVIKLTVSLGDEMVTVPDLTGLTKQEAEKLLADNKLNGEFTEEYCDTVEKNKVINQNIIGYTQVEINSIIKIIISKGKILFGC